MEAAALTDAATGSGGGGGGGNTVDSDRKEEWPERRRICDNSTALRNAAASKCPGHSFVSGIDASSIEGAVKACRDAVSIDSTDSTATTVVAASRSGDAVESTSWGWDRPPCAAVPAACE